MHQLILADGLLNNPCCNEERDRNLNSRVQGGRGSNRKSSCKNTKWSLVVTNNVRTWLITAGPSPFSQLLARRQSMWLRKSYQEMKKKGKIKINTTTIELKVEQWKESTKLVGRWFHWCLLGETPQLLLYANKKQPDKTVKIEFDWAIDLVKIAPYFQKEMQKRWLLFSSIHI